MTVVALWWSLCLIPKFVPPALSHSSHLPPANAQLNLAPQCVVKWSGNRKLRVRICWQPR